MRKMQHLHLVVIIVLCTTQTFSSRPQDDPTPLEVTKESSDLTLECSKSEDEAENSKDLTSKIKTKEDQIKRKTDLPDTLSQESHGKTHLDPFTKSKKENVQEKEIDVRTTEISEGSTKLQISGVLSEASNDTPGKSEGLKEALQKEEKGEEGEERGVLAKEKDAWAVGVQAIGGALTRARSSLISSIDRRGKEMGRSFSSGSFSSLESTLLSLAFLTFAVFLVDLVQDLLNGTTSTSTGRKRRSEKEDEERMTDLIVLALSSVDTLSFGADTPDCGRKLLCHLNRAGWHDGWLGTASNYFVSLVFSILSSSTFQDNLEAANFGREKQDCTSRYPSCPSVLGELLPSRK
ncbi:uncharacterized protein LOC135110069 [Scylla paramamosain]|uniref:uncharacterized protein LOC135110069 n=1 Tax=Scylla paramamosain TaxID=85552 RepID=UPI0030830FE2